MRRQRRRRKIEVLKYTQPAVSVAGVGKLPPPALSRYPAVWGRGPGEQAEVLCELTAPAEMAGAQASFASGVNAF